MLHRIRQELALHRLAANLEGRRDSRFVVCVSGDAWQEMMCQLMGMYGSAISSDPTIDGAKVFITVNLTEDYKIFEDRLLLKEARPGGGVRAQYAR